jgi:hypothetical protein
MPSLSNIVFAVISLLAVTTGAYLIYGNYYINMGSSAVLPSSGLNQTGAVQYVGNWGNQTQNSLSNAQAIPFFGGSFMLLTGAFQSITLLVNFPAMIIYPLFQSIMVALAIPGWLQAFLVAMVILACMVALLHAFGIGGL